MRWVTYSRGSTADKPDATTSVGVLQGDAVYGLTSGTRMRTLLEAEGDSIAVAGRNVLEEPHEVLSLDEVRLHAPIPDPPTIRDFVTFKRHIEGAIKVAGADRVLPQRWYAAPTFYFTNPYSVLGPEDNVPVTPGATLFDLELEIAVVIGLGGKDITAADAEKHIAGYTIMNDWTARDLQFAEMEVGLGPAKGKDSSLTLGPSMVTPDLLEPYRSGNSFDLKMTAKINGDLLGSDRCNSMNWSFAEMIEYASRGAEVRPGDVLGSGTCGGGCLAELWGRHGMDAHPPLRSGDIVEVSIEQLGTIRSEIIDYPAPSTPNFMGSRSSD